MKRLKPAKACFGQPELAGEHDCDDCDACHGRLGIFMVDYPLMEALI